MGETRYLSTPLDGSVSEETFSLMETGIVALAKRERCDLSTLRFTGVHTHDIKTGRPFEYAQLEWQAE